MSVAIVKMQKNVEKQRVYTGLLEIELKIEQKKEEIRRLQESADVSKQKIEELDLEIMQLEDVRD